MLYPDMNSQKKTQQTRYRTALYLRLSREDGDKTESDSIANQRTLLEAYLAMFQFLRKTSGTALTRSCTSGWKNTVICRSWYGKALEKANSNQKK